MQSVVVQSAIRHPGYALGAAIVARRVDQLTADRTHVDHRRKIVTSCATTIGDNCEIREGVRLEGCVLYDGCRIDEASVIRDSILGQELSLGKRVHVEEAAVLGDRMIVQEENYLKKGIRIWPDTEIEAGKIRF